MASSRGYRYILVMVDAFSRWVEAVPLCNKSATTVAGAIMRTWIVRYGVMESLHSDNGLEFENTIMRHLCEWTGAVKTHTTPYHPQGNGAVERMNRTLKEIVTCLCRDHGSSWSDELPFALWAVRNCISQATGHSPYHVLFGKPMPMPFDYEVNETADPKSATLYTEYVTELVRKVGRLHTQIAEANKLQQSRAKTKYDQHSLERTFQPGDLVLARELRLPSDQSTGEKFYPKWRGPYEVIVAFTPHTYLLRKREDRTELTAHVNTLKPFHTPEGLTDDTDADTLPAWYRELDMPPPTCSPDTHTDRIPPDTSHTVPADTSCACTAETSRSSADAETSAADQGALAGTPVSTDMASADSKVHTKRKRGRPRKDTQPPQAAAADKAVQRAEPLGTHEPTAHASQAHLAEPQADVPPAQVVVQLADGQPAAPAEAQSAPEQAQPAAQT
jgi:hypothetical protein